MSACVFYLRKNQQEPEIPVFKLFPKKLFKTIINDMETTEEYINRIKTLKYSETIQKDVAFHLRQLIEINIDCRLVYEWLCRDFGEEKAMFFSEICSAEKLGEFLDFKKYHFTTSELKQFDKSLLTNFEDDFNERIKELYKDIERFNENFNDISSREKIFFNKGFIDCLVVQGLFSNLGFIPRVFNGTGNFAIDEKGQKIPVIDYTTRLQKYYDKNSGKFMRINDLKTFYKNISDLTLDDYVKVWYLLGKEDKRKNKTKMYETMTKEELLEVFHKKYKVQDNFFNLLQEKKYNGKITFDENYKLINNNFLVINYLYECAVDGSDYKLLEALFGKKNLDSYIREYRTDELKQFKDFLKINKNS